MLTASVLEKQQKSYSFTSFCNIFEAKNLSLFTPKKDQCALCVRFLAGNLSQETYNLHQERKERIKDTDNETQVYTVALQSVLMASKSEVTSLYYRTKFQVYNLVFYNLKNKGGFCFLWSEVEGGLISEDF